MTFLLRALILGLTLLFFTFFYLYINEDKYYPGADFQTSDMPKFELFDLYSEKVINQDNLDGTFLINVWASWCITCRVEHPFLIDLKDKGVPIIGLNYKDNKDDAINWLKNFKSPYEISIHDFYGTLALDLGVTGAPETYLLKDGIIVRRHIGELNIEKWRQDFAEFF